MTLDQDNQIFSELSQASLAQQALVSIRQAIVKGDLKPGQPLRETDIASQMGISRAPVREALLVLEEGGLVERVPHRGTFVAPFSRQDVEEVYGLRTVLECFAIELLVDHLTDADFQALQAILEEMRTAAEDGDADGLNRYDLEFHEYIVARTGHKRLLSTWQALKFQIHRVITAANILNEDLNRIAENHVPILAALEAQDANRAKRLIEQHISDSGNRFIANWEQIRNSASGLEPVGKTS